MDKYDDQIAQIVKEVKTGKVPWLMATNALIHINKKVATEARREAVEECAKVADKHFAEHQEDGESYLCFEMTIIAKAIRSLGGSDDKG